MTPDRRIPALALLGLSFTTCTDRAKDDGGDGSDDPIVGDWTVSQIDSDAFPMTYGGVGYGARQGWTMTVDPDLVGDLAYYILYEGGEYEGLQGGQFSRFDLTVDAGKAPQYRLEVPFALLAFDNPEEPYSTSDTRPPSDTYADTYADTGYGESAGYDSDTSPATTGGVHDVPAGGPPIALPPTAAPGDPPTLILVCNLVQSNALDCQRERVADDNDRALHWRFKRADPDMPPPV